MISTTVRFVLIFVVLVAAVLLTLAVGGVLSSDELWNSLKKVGLLAAIVFGASVLMALIAKEK